MIPVVAISRCLLGEKVRYDGGDKQHGLIVNVLVPRIVVVPVCPEWEAGLGIPRRPVRLVSGPGGRIRVQTAEPPYCDWTARMIGQCRRWVGDWGRCLDGAVLKGRSPSCGSGDVPLAEGGEDTDGLLVRALKGEVPQMPVSNDSRLRTVDEIEAFLRAVRLYRRSRKNPVYAVGW